MNIISIAKREQLPQDARIVILGKGPAAAGLDIKIKFGFEPKTIWHLQARNGYQVCYARYPDDEESA